MHVARITFPRSPRVLAASLLAIILLTTSALLAIAAETGTTVKGLYDDAGVFTDEEAAEIEVAIDRVENAGAPTVVYLRLLHTEDDQAVEDGQRLMEEWDVQSAEGALDGVVIFFNLEPDDPNRGEFGIVAGAAHYDGGALPQSRLNTIRDEMISLLADDRIAEAIVLGLDMTAEYLEAGPPEPTAFQTLTERVASGPVSIANALALVVTGALGAIGWRTWRDRPQARYVYEEKTVTPPSDLHPALAGALVQGSVNASQVEAILLDLARNGAIAIEPDESRWSKKARLRILNQRRAFTAYELEVLRILVEHAGDDQVLKQSDISKTQSRWGDVQQVIQKDLENTGWFDPNAGQKRTPLWVTGALGLILGALVAFVPLAVLEEGWSLIGGGVLGLLGLTLLIMASNYPRTTPDGEREAVPWRGYQKGLKDAAKMDYGAIDLDEAFPFIVSMGLTSNFKKHLEDASKAGYVPAWIIAEEHQRRMLADNWFIYWFAFHNSVRPSSSGGGGAGGAAAGSGGAGGRF
jgi:uncharacterized protein (TIGR04222 family)